MSDVEKVKRLENTIQKARSDYYNGESTLDDLTYDSLVDQLAGISPENPAVTAIGAPPVSAWPKVAHTIPMGSLDKVQTPEELTDWVSKFSRASNQLNPERHPTGHEHLVVIDKLDGISVSLRYVDGQFVQALTRGDGVIGEDITPNVRRMKGVPAVLPQPVTVVFRGEILLLKSDHREYFPEMANPRNAASGIAKRLSGEQAEHLTVMCYQALDSEGQDIRYEIEGLQFIKDMGLMTPNWFHCEGFEPVVAVWREYQAEGVGVGEHPFRNEKRITRESLDYEIDGLVVRFDDLAHQWSLGEHNGRPKGAVAFKFAPVAKETTAIGRVDQVGGTGRITPVAVFDPIEILGAEISRASLYNQAYIETIGFDVGAKILVSRANDVIPRVVSVVSSTGTVSRPPEKCPECGAETAQDGEYIVCPNTGGCPAQTEGRIKQWVRELGIMEWGPTLIQKTVSSGYVKSVPDLYRLTAGQVAGLDRMGESSSRKAIEELWKVVPLSLEQFLGALSIPLCATSTIQTVVDAGLDSLDKIRTATNEQLCAIPGVGPKRADALATWLAQNGGLIDDLLTVGVTLKDRPKGVLTGKSVCFTGKSNLKRSELERVTTEAGGSVKKSVGKGLTYLVMASVDSGSTKAKAAQKNGVQCLSEADFLKMVGYH